jgi:hypothetical protein
MPELRQNFFAKKRVIIASQRARRVEKLATHRAVQKRAVVSATWPFYSRQRK